jgi:hypothetical protein
MVRSPDQDKKDLLTLLDEMVATAAMDAGWGTLDLKPYPSDPKLRNCETVGAFVGSLRAQLRAAKKLASGGIIEKQGLLTELKDAADQRADLFKKVGGLQVESLSIANGETQAKLASRLS